MRAADNLFILYDLATQIRVKLVLAKLSREGATGRYQPGTGTRSEQFGHGDASAATLARVISWIFAERGLSVGV